MPLIIEGINWSVSFTGFTLRINYVKFAATKLRNFILTTAFAQLQFLPSQIEIVDTVTSTNDYLKQWSAGFPDLAEGQVVWALHQTKGRGQKTNTWEAKGGQNITLSILLKPENLRAKDVFLLSKAISIALYNTVSSYVKTGISIKWPNDIFAGNQKIAGILIENSIHGDWVKQSIVGIGLNVNQTEFSIDNYPTSLAIILREKLDLNEVVSVLLKNISTLYLQLQQENYKKISQDYFSKLYNIKREQTFLIHNQQRLCFINDVFENGSIVLTIDDKKEVYLYGDAKWKI